MPNRHERRKVAAICNKSKLKSFTLDRHFDETLRRVRAEFERNGEIHPGFQCMNDAEIFDVRFASFSDGGGILPIGS